MGLCASKPTGKRNPHDQLAPHQRPEKQDPTTFPDSPDQPEPSRSQQHAKDTPDDGTNGRRSFALSSNRNSRSSHVFDHIEDYSDSDDDFSEFEEEGDGIIHQSNSRMDITDGKPKSKQQTSGSKLEDEQAYLGVPVFDALSPKDLPLISRIFYRTTYNTGGIIQAPPIKWTHSVSKKDSINSSPLTVSKKRELDSYGDELPNNNDLESDFSFSAATVYPVPLEFPSEGSKTDLIADPGTPSKNLKATPNSTTPSPRASPALSRNGSTPSLKALPVRGSFSRSKSKSNILDDDEGVNGNHANLTDHITDEELRTSSNQLQQTIQNQLNGTPKLTSLQLNPTLNQQPSPVQTSTSSSSTSVSASSSAQLNRTNKYNDILSLASTDNNNILHVIVRGSVALYVHNTSIQQQYIDDLIPPHCAGCPVCHQHLIPKNSTTGEQKKHRRERGKRGGGVELKAIQEGPEDFTPLAAGAISEDGLVGGPLGALGEDEDIVAPLTSLPGLSESQSKPENIQAQPKDEDKTNKDATPTVSLTSLQFPPPPCHQFLCEYTVGQIFTTEKCIQVNSDNTTLHSVAIALEHAVVLSIPLSILQEALHPYPKLSLTLSVPLASLSTSTMNVSLQTIPFFRSMSPQKLSILSRLFTIRKAASNRIIFKEGQKSDGIYLLLDGLCEVTAKNSQHKPIYLYTITNGQWFGENALVGLDISKSNTHNTNDDNQGQNGANNPNVNNHFAKRTKPLPRASTVTSIKHSTFLFLHRRRLRRFFNIAPELLLGYDPNAPNADQYTSTSSTEDLSQSNSSQAIALNPNEPRIYINDEGHLTDELNTPLLDDDGAPIVASEEEKELFTRQQAIINQANQGSRGVFSAQQHQQQRFSNLSSFSSLLNYRSGEILKTISLFSSLQRKVVGAKSFFDEVRLSQLCEIMEWNYLDSPTIAPHPSAGGLSTSSLNHQGQWNQNSFNDSFSTTAETTGTQFSSTNLPGKTYYVLSSNTHGGVYCEQDGELVPGMFIIVRGECKITEHRLQYYQLKQFPFTLDPNFLPNGCMQQNQRETTLHSSTHQTNSISEHSLSSGARPNHHHHQQMQPQHIRHINDHDDSMDDEFSYEITQPVTPRNYGSPSDSRASISSNFSQPSTTNYPPKDHKTSNTNSTNGKKDESDAKQDKQSDRSQPAKSPKPNTGDHSSISSSRQTKKKIKIVDEQGEQDIIAHSTGVTRILKGGDYFGEWLLLAPPTITNDASDWNCSKSRFDTTNNNNNNNNNLYNNPMGFNHHSQSLPVPKHHQTPFANLSKPASKTTMQKQGPKPKRIKPVKILTVTPLTPDTLLLSLPCNSFRRFSELCPEIWTSIQARFDNLEAQICKAQLQRNQWVFNIIQENRSWSKLDNLSSIWKCIHIPRGSVISEVGEELFIKNGVNLLSSLSQLSGTSLQRSASNTYRRTNSNAQLSSSNSSSTITSAATPVITSQSQPSPPLSAPRIEIAGTGNQRDQLHNAIRQRLSSGGNSQSNRPQINPIPTIHSTQFGPTSNVSALIYGDVPCVYLLIQGHIDVSIPHFSPGYVDAFDDGTFESRIRPDGSILVEVLQANDFFGYFPRLTQPSQRSLTKLTCLTDCVVLMLPLSKLFHNYAIAPELHHKILAQLKLRVENLVKLLPYTNTIIENRRWSKKELVATLFKSYSVDTGSVLFGTSEDIAEYQRTCPHINNENDQNSAACISQVVPTVNTGIWILLGGEVEVVRFDHHDQRVGYTDFVPSTTADKCDENVAKIEQPTPQSTSANPTQLHATPNCQPPLANVVPAFRKKYSRPLIFGEELLLLDLINKQQSTPVTSTSQLVPSTSSSHNGVFSRQKKLQLEKSTQSIVSTSLFEDYSDVQLYQKYNELKATALGSTQGQSSSMVGSPSSLDPITSPNNDLFIPPDQTLNYTSTPSNHTSFVPKPSSKIPYFIYATKPSSFLVIHDHNDLLRLLNTAPEFLSLFIDLIEAKLRPKLEVNPQTGKIDLINSTTGCDECVVDLPCLCGILHEQFFDLQALRLFFNLQTPDAFPTSNQFPTKSKQPMFNNTLFSQMQQRESILKSSGDVRGDLLNLINVNGPYHEANSTNTPDEDSSFEEPVIKTLEQAQREKGLFASAAPTIAGSNNVKELGMNRTSMRRSGGTSDRPSFRLSLNQQLTSNTRNSRVGLFSYASRKNNNFLGAGQQHSASNSPQQSPQSSSTDSHAHHDPRQDPLLLSGTDFPRISEASNESSFSLQQSMRSEGLRASLAADGNEEQPLQLLQPHPITTMPSTLEESSPDE